MLTLKTNVAAIIVVAAVAASSTVTYAVMHHSMEVNCTQPASAARTMPSTPDIPTTNGKRY
jgi:hypothetical protein